MNAVITGIGEFPPSRRSEIGLPSMVMSAVRRALDEACLSASDIEGIATESSIMPSLLPAADLIGAMKMDNVRISVLSSPTGAGIMQALGLACSIVESGAAKHVLSYFGVDWASRRNGPGDYHNGMSAKSAVETPVGYAGPPLYFAMAARRYAGLYGLSDEVLERMLADVVMSMRTSARAHDHAQLKTPIDFRGYLDSPLIASPLRKDDCCLLSDGAVAFVVSHPDAARIPRDRQVRMAGWAWANDRWDDQSFYSQSDLPLIGAATASFASARAKAGISHADVSVRQLYDCFSIATVLQLESLGFCGLGEAPGYVADGALSYRGEHPTNTHGGLIAHGYLLAANHISEAVTQLRHEAGRRQVADATVALVGAGPGRQYCSLILRREED